MQLLRWTADYYHHPLGEVIASAPPQGAASRRPADRHAARWSLTAAGLRRSPGDWRGVRRASRRYSSGSPAQPSGPGRERPRARARTLARGGPGAAAARLARARSSSRATGTLEPAAVAPSAPIAAPPELSSAQRDAIAAIDAAAGHYAAFVLRGATGSGKTEVYLQCTERALARGGECAGAGARDRADPAAGEPLSRAPALAGGGAAFRPERWGAARGLARGCASGSARVVLGTRSAVFAPLPALGLIVVDEEHDSSYKQQEGGCRYSARDLAVMRAQQCGVAGRARLGDPGVRDAAQSRARPLSRARAATARRSGRASATRADRSARPRGASRGCRCR